MNIKSTATATPTIPDNVNTIPVVVVSDIIDRWEGLSQTYEIWGDAPSTRYVSQVLANDDDRARVSKFFVTREFAGVFKNLVRAHTVKPVECLLTKTDVYAALSEILTGTQAGVVMELILPALIDLGIVSGNMKYSYHVRYGMKTVSTEDVRNDVATYQVLQAVKATKASNIDRNTKHSVAALAELLAETFRRIGLELYEMNDLAIVVEDMVKGVRANIDPTLSSGALSGIVSSDWKRGRIVDELSKNLVFIRAAMELPPGSNVSLTCEGWKLEKWGPIILAALQSSERYAWISKAESLRTYGLRKVRDVKGRVRSVIVYRAAKVQPVAQAVFAIEDSLMAGTYNINSTKDRVAEVVQSAYGDATFSTESGADLVSSVLTDGIEAGWMSSSSVMSLDATTNETDLCCMLASRLYVELPSRDYTNTIDSGLNVDAYVPKWWYAIETTELDLDVYSGVHRGSEVYTDDPATLLMAAKEFEHMDFVAPKPQVLGPTAFNTRVVAFDERILRSVKTRFSFDVVINDVAMRGAFKPGSFASMRTSEMTSLVVPHYNELVIDSLRRAFEAATDIVSKMEKSSVEAWVGQKPGAEFFGLLKRRIARAILSLAQQLSKGFRKEVHDAVMDRSIATVENLSIDDAVKMRARLSQRAYAACADVLAMQFFLFIQGISDDSWIEMSNSAEMVRTYLEVGSDREKD